MVFKPTAFRFATLSEEKSLVLTMPEPEVVLGCNIWRNFTLCACRMDVQFLEWRCWRFVIFKRRIPMICGFWEAEMRFLLFSIWVAVPMLSAGEPDAKDIVANYVKAIGGVDKVMAIKSLKKEGIYVYNGLEHPLTLWQKGEKILFEIDGLQMYGQTVDKGKVVLRGYDGQQAWDLDPNREVPVAAIPEPKAVSLISEAVLISALARPGVEPKLHGKLTLEGVEVWHVEIPAPNGAPQSWYLDSKTWLPVKMSTPEKDMFSPQAVFFSDYREVAGVLMPHYVELEEGLFARVHIFDKMTANLDIPDNKFSKPAK